MTSPRNAFLLSFCLTALALTSGCGGETFGDKVAALESEFEVQVALICDCYAELQFDSREECVAQNFVPLDAAERQCVIDAAALDQAGSDANMDCLVAANEAATDCLNAQLVCAELNMMNNGLMNCGIAYQTAAGNCPDLPQNVQDASNACFQ